MRSDVLRVLNDPALLETREYHMDRITRLYAGERLDRPVILREFVPRTGIEPRLEPEAWVEAAYNDLAAHAELLADRKIFTPPSPIGWIYGVHFTDAVFGCRILFRDGNWWSRPLENEIGELPVPDLEKNEVWQAAKRLTLAQVESGAALPFVTTQVLGGPWNQLYNVYKERVLYAFFDDPAGLRRDLGVMTDVLEEMHRWFQSVIPADRFQPVLPHGRCQPRGFGQMCGCCTHLLSAGLYADFVREFDERIIRLYPNGVMLHLCGGHTQHLPVWREMPGVRALQLNDRATDDLELYYAGTRPDQMLYVYPTGTYPVPRIGEVTEGFRRTVLSIQPGERDRGLEEL